MSLFQRGTRLLWAIALFAIPTTLFAQDNTATIVGSGIVTPLFETIVAEAEADLTVEADVTGTTSGFAAFCNGEADVVTANRPMTLEEEAGCEANGITFGEIVLGYDAVVVVVNPALDFLSCLTANELSSALAPSSVNNTLWGEALAAAEDQTEATVELFLPNAASTSYFLADEIINGVGFRADAETLADTAAILEAVANSNGGIGIVGLDALDIADDNVLIAELRNNTIARCVEPTPETIGDGSYQAGTPLLAYVNTASLAENAELATAFDFVGSEDSAPAIATLGFAPPTDFDYGTNTDVASSDASGRQFSRALTNFQIPPTVTGTVNIAGAAALNTLLNRAGTDFNQQYQNVTVNVQTLGEPDGVRRLCNGEIDLTATYSGLTDEIIDNCGAANIDVFEIEIGSQTAVLVANKAADYLECLTTEEIVTTWQAASTDNVTTWADVNSEYPEDEFILFAGNSSNEIPNLMLLRANPEGFPLPLRLDTEIDNDPLYRAAATANVETALTYMSWAQYQDVLANEQERIQLVAVDAGEGCIVPTEDTITNGEYPLTRSASLLVSMSSLQGLEVQGYLWFTFQDSRFGNFQLADFDLLNLKTLFDIRDTLQTQFELATIAAAVDAVEATVEAEAPSGEAETTEEATISETEETE